MLLGTRQASNRWVLAQGSFQTIKIKLQSKFFKNFVLEKEKGERKTEQVKYDSNDDAKSLSLYLFDQSRFFYIIHYFQ
jgi:hypothetical protein